MNSKIKITYCNDSGEEITNPVEGQKAYSPQTRSLYVYKNGEWELITGDMNLGMTTYDLNKQIISQLGVLEGNELTEARDRLTNFVNDTNNKFYMLLCRDINYYTLFEIDNGDNTLDSFANEVFYCVEEIGAVKSVDGVEGAIEIWVHPIDGEPLVMYLFTYDMGVIKCTA